MPIDFYGPTNQGLQTLNQTFQNIRQEDRQSREDLVRNQVIGQQMLEGRLRIAETLKRRKEEADVQKYAGEGINSQKPVNPLGGDSYSVPETEPVTYTAPRTAQDLSNYAMSKGYVDQASKYQGLATGEASLQQHKQATAASVQAQTKSKFDMIQNANKMAGGNAVLMKQYLKASGMDDSTLSEISDVTPEMVKFKVGDQDGVILPDGTHVISAKPTAPAKLTETDYIAAAAGGDKAAEKVVKAIEVHKKATQKPEKPTPGAKPTSLTALNPESGKVEYLMNDNTFSGRAVTKVGGASNSIAVKRLSDMVKAAGDSPNASDIAAISAAAEPLGMTFEQVSETTPGVLWGTNTKESWRLLGGENAPNKVAPAAISKPPAGFKLDPQGRKVGGKPAYISADGKKVWTE